MGLNFRRRSFFDKIQRLLLRGSSEILSLFPAGACLHFQPLRCPPQRIWYQSSCFADREEEGSSLEVVGKLHVSTLPICNKLLLSRVMPFLTKVLDKGKDNGVTFEVMLSVFGPALIRPHPRITITAAEEKERLQKLAMIFQFFLRESGKIFAVRNTSILTHSFLDTRNPTYLVGN